MSAADATDLGSTHVTAIETAHDHGTVIRLGVALLVLVLLGPAAGIAAFVAHLRGMSRPRALAVACIGVLATAVAWLAGGVPSSTEIAVFTNLGGRDWIDAPARAAIGLLAMAVVLPDDQPRPPGPTPSVALGGREGRRLWEVDRLRAVAIVAVVVIHGLPFRGPITGYLDYWLSDLLRFSVATFFFVSGWLLPHAPVGVKWLVRRLGRILPPYVLASAVMLLLARVSPLIESRPVLQSLLLGDAVGPYYFVVVLVALTVLTPVLQRLPASLRRLLLALSILSALAIEVADLSLYLHNHLPMTWLPYYLAGMELRPRRKALVGISDRIRALVVGVTAILVLALALAPVETTPRRLLTGLCIWALLATLFVIATSARGEPSRLTRRLSGQSYLIYLYHPPIVAGVAGVFGSSMLTLRPGTAAVSALAMCLAFGQLAQLAWPRGARRWLSA